MQVIVWWQRIRIKKEDVEKDVKKSHFRSKSRGWNDRCHYYEQEGHWKKDCPRLKSKKKQDPDKAEVATKSEEGDVLTISSGIDSLVI